MGQNVNKANTACTVRHLPKGVSVTTPDSRSQYSNRQLVLGRLLELFEKCRGETKKLRGKVAD